MNKTVNNELIKIRAQLGRYRHESGEWVLLKAKGDLQHGDSKPYSVVHFEGRYKSCRRWDIREIELRNMLTFLITNAFKLVEPAYPELQKFFKNGAPVTHLTELADAWDKMPVSDAKYGFDALVDAM